MGRDIRTFRRGAMMHVTNRTYHDELRLTPSPAVTLIVRGCLLRAVARTGVGLVVAMVMGNHFELVVDSPIARLDDCMEYFQKEVSHRLNRMRGLADTNFPRRYDAFELKDREVCERKIAEILCNPVRAQLVYDVDKWPGFSTLRAHRASASVLESPYLTRPEASALDEGAPLPAWVDSLETVNAPLRRPGFAEGMSLREWHAHVVALVEAEEARLQADIDKRNGRTVGFTRIQEERWDERPRAVKWRKYRRCIANEASQADEYDEYYKDTERQYKEAARRWRRYGEWGEYPPGTFPPGWLRCVTPSSEVGPPMPWMQGTGRPDPGGRPPPG